MKKRIDPKLPIPQLGGGDTPDPPVKPDGYQDRLNRRLFELFREFDDGTLAIYDDGVYKGQADGLNFTSNLTAAQSSTLPDGIFDIDATGGGGGAQDTITATAVESIAAGQFVAVYNASGTPKCRVAKSSSGQGYQADGFAKSAYTVGATVTIYLPGAKNVAGGTGLTAGDVWLGTDGYATNTPPSTAGYISQQIGVAEDATKVAFEPQPDILIATPSTPSTGGSLQAQEFTSSGTFTVPSGVTGVWITAVGGGGGGRGTASGEGTGGGGGGAGELVENVMVPVTSGGTVTVTIGAGGTAGSSSNGGNGGTTSFGSLVAVQGGFGGGNTNSGGVGGGIRGAAAASANAAGVLGTSESPTAFGGSGGGGGGALNTSGGAGGGAAGLLAGGAGGSNASTKAGGGGGAATRFGVGGAGGAGEASGSNAPTTSYGAGGGGGGANASTARAGGTGCAGYVLVGWVA